MQNFKTKLQDNECYEISQQLQQQGYSNSFILYVLSYFKMLYNNAYIYNTTASKQLSYCSAVNTISYSVSQSKIDLLEHYKDINVFLDNNNDYRQYCYLFFENIEKFELLIISKLFNDYAKKYDVTLK